MEQIGIITEKNNNIVKVQFKRASACGENCGMCGGCEKLNSFVDALDTVDAQVGDTVKLETNTSYVLSGAFFAYIVPVILGIVGFLCVSIYFGIALFFVPFIVLRVVNSRLEKYFRPRVVKILKKG